MSAFGDDCHFYYNSTCVKGASCPFRHSEAAKKSETTCTFWKQNRCSKPYCTFRHAELATKQKNRADIACYWENQPVGCAKANCPFKHFKPRPNTAVVNSDDSTQSAAKSDSGDQRQPDSQNVGEEQQQTVQTDQVVVHPVIVNIAEDSDVEMTSPAKQPSAQKRNPVNTSTQLQQAVKPVKVVKKKILQDSIPKTKTVKKTYSPKSEQLLTSNVSRKKAVPQTVKMKPVVPEERLSAKQRIQKQSAKTEPRLSVKERLHKVEEAAKKPSVKDRLQLGHNQGYSSDEGRKPVHQRISKPYASDTQTSDSDGEGVEVKSLEQIQREKALRSMGLMELKDGTIVKLSEYEKKDEETNKNDAPSESSEEEQAVHSDSEEEDEQEVEEEEAEEEEEDEEEIENEEEESEEEEEESEKEEEENEEEVEEEELVEPDIDILEPEVAEEIQDTRQALPKESIPAKDIKKAAKKKISPVILDSQNKVKKRRNVIIEDEDATPVLKESLRSRLGKRIEVDKDIVISVGNTPKGTVKRRLGVKETIGSTNQGTVKTVAGIKSRLGWTSSPVQPNSEHDDDDDEKEEEASLSPASKRRGWRKQNTANSEVEGLMKSEGAVKKRRWRKADRVKDDAENEIDTTSEGSSNSRPCTPVEEEEEDLTKKRKTEHTKKEVDPGAKVQNAITQRWKKLGVWSSRNQENQPAKRKEELEKLGIGIIDLQGGKVVKMGKKDDIGRETTAGKDGDEWVKESMRKLAAKREARKERAIYVPPALKRSGSSTSTVASSPPRKRVTQNEVDSDNESKDEPEVKTFAQIMAAKRQRQKRALEKEEFKKSKKIIGLIEENSNDSTDIPNEASEQQEEEKPKKEHSKSEHKKHRSKKVSKWRRKSKSKTDKTDKSEDSKDVEQVSEKENTNVDNEVPDSSNIHVGDGENVPLADDSSDLKKRTSLDHIDAGSKSEISDLKVGKQDEENSSPSKRTEHLLSDSWLEFDSEELGVEDKDDDDLLKEIDELLA